MSRRRGRAVVVALALGVAAAVLAGARGTSAGPVPEPAPPEVELVGGTYDSSDPEIARRLAAGEDPATIPGVHLQTGEPRPPEPSVPAHR